MENVTIRITCQDGLQLLAYVTSANGDELQVEFVDVPTNGEVNLLYAQSLK